MKYTFTSNVPQDVRDQIKRESPKPGLYFFHSVPIRVWSTGKVQRWELRMIHAEEGK